MTNLLTIKLLFGTVFNIYKLSFLSMIIKNELFYYYYSLQR